MSEDRRALGPGEVLRGIFHQNDHGPASPYPDGIEQFPSIRDAKAALVERAAQRLSTTYYVGEEPGTGVWPDADRTAYMDVWVETPDPDEAEPAPPGDYWQRWTLYGSGVRRTNF